ncbi:MAG: pyrroline-5-carboxylate reductase [Candidatus Woesearchaeota archaeon]
MKFGIIGAGNIGKALIDRMLLNNVDVLVSSKKEGSYKGIKIVSDNEKVAKNSDVIILTVKPQSMSNVLEQINSSVKGKLVISLAAGLRINFFESRLQARIVRVMTNLAIKTGQGISVYKLSDSCGLEYKETVEKVLGYLGRYIEVSDENFLDVITGISGSGIAYLIRIINVFIESAESFGMDKKIARRIIIETINGASSLIENNESDCEEIINCIASKGGTTEEGLREFKKRDLDGILKNVIIRTINKSKIVGDKNG